MSRMPRHDRNDEAATFDRTKCSDNSPTNQPPGGGVSHSSSTGPINNLQMKFGNRVVQRMNSGGGMPPRRNQGVNPVDIAAVALEHQQREAIRFRKQNARALTASELKIVINNNVPPGNLREQLKDEYEWAMKKALGEQDFSSLERLAERLVDLGFL